jgi:RNA polymerase sigma-70 factor, ECF subfamily
VTASPDTGPLIEHLFRQQAGRMVAHLTRRNQVLGDKTNAIVSELTRLATVVPNDPDIEEQLRDDELRMIFMCCHPEISRDSSVALSLKTVGGFSVREIARGFLADDATIAQRLVRARRQIRDQCLTLEMPRPAELKRRLDSVLDVLYFMFNEGYAAHAGEELIRQDLCLEALRLGRLVASSSIAAPRACHRGLTRPAISSCLKIRTAAAGIRSSSAWVFITSIDRWPATRSRNFTRKRPSQPRTPAPAPRNRSIGP